jgi:epoxyqueuosine reductase
MNAADAVPGRERIKAQAYALGFDLAGVAALGPAETAPAFDAWLGRGFAGAMHYLQRGAHARRDPRAVVPGAVSAIVTALDYGGSEPSGPVARYARGNDYHDLIRDRLDALRRWLEQECGHTVGGRSYVDTGPILERDLARRAGLGWFGKNTMLINPERGSFFFLGALLVDIALEPDAPFDADRCGTCRRCLDACPTGAIVEPRVLDARRCISYLTIELRDAIPVAFREPIGSLVFGCDICQDVCPWNAKFARGLPDESPLAAGERAGRPDGRALARSILAMDDQTYRAAFRNSAMKRAKLRGLKRNAAVVLGNVGTSDDEPVLATASMDDDPLVREHAAWAMARLANRTTSPASHAGRGPDS